MERRHLELQLEKDTLREKELPKVQYRYFLTLIKTKELEEGVAEI